ncbi:MAG: hypothetical protein ACM3JG_20495 [Thiohalocapsa sp.]
MRRKRGTAARLACGMILALGLAVGLTATPAQARHFGPFGPFGPPFGFVRPVFYPPPPPLLLPPPPPPVYVVPRVAYVTPPVVYRYGYRHRHRVRHHYHHVVHRSSCSCHCCR